MSFRAGISASKAGLGLIQDVLGLVRREEVDRSEVLARLQELQGLLLETRQALSDGEDENRELRRKIQDTERQRAIEEDVDYVEDGGFFVSKSQRADGVFCPLCPLCLRKDHQLVPLAPAAKGYYECRIHDAVFKTEAFHEAQRQKETKRQADANAFAIVRPRGGPNSWMGS
jgi:DNA repair exonuclease SbcCD ATPase subunit